MIWRWILPFGLLGMAFGFVLKGETLNALVMLNSSLLAMILATLNRK